MRASERARWAVRALEPRGLASIRTGLRFGREHSLSSSPRAWVEGFRRGQEFGLQHLPPTLSLTGLVVDAGANRGDFTALIRELEPRSRVLAIEPIPMERERLRQRFAGDPQVTICGQALSDAAGDATLNITSESVHTSLLKAVQDTMEIYGGGTEVVEQVEVSTARLDDLLDEPVSLLKMDVQGHEIPALRGAERTLARTRVVLLEVLFQAHYQGDAPFSELHAFMQDAGFALCGLSVPHLFDGRVLWADACYRASTDN